MRSEKLLPIAFLAVLPALAGVDGTVTNQTTGKPAVATVTLYKLGEAGMESMETVKSAADGKFTITMDLKGPRLIQTAFEGVTYNHMLPPGAPSTGVALDVYNASKQPGGAKVIRHGVLLEPSEKEMVVREIYFWENNGKTAYNDPDGGTLKFFLPPGVIGKVEVNATAPQGMPIRRPADKTSQANVYKVDFPIKPGQSRIELTYTLPYTSPATFVGKDLFKGGATQVVVPSTVTLKGDVELLGKEPDTQLVMYTAKGTEYKVEVEGTGSLRAAVGDVDGEEGGGPGIDQIMPRLYSKMYWVLGLALSILALTFAVQFRASVSTGNVAGKR